MSSGDSSDSDLEELVSMACSKISSLTKFRMDTRSSKSTRLKKSKSQHGVSSLPSTVISANDVEKDNSNTLEDIGFVIDKKGVSDTEKMFSTIKTDDSNELMTEQTVNQDSTSDQNNSNTEGNRSHQYNRDVYEKPKKQSRREKKQRFKLASSIQTNLSLEDTYLRPSPNSKTARKSVQNSIKGASDPDKNILKKSVLTPDVEREHSIPAYSERMKQLQHQKRIDRQNTLGKNWFGLKAAELTEEKKNDLKILKMRKALDPKRFYKAGDLKGLPKFVQFGRVVDTPADFYHARVPKKQRKNTLVEELLADAQFRSYNKRKYAEIVDNKRNKTGAYQRTHSLTRRKKPEKKQKGKKKGR